MITVRPMRTDDARAFLEVHHAAVRGIAAADYPPPVIEAWAPLPITDRTVDGFLANPDQEIRLVAEIDGAIVGVGALVPGKTELRACYVAPGAARRCVGSALVREIERIARQQGLAFLELDSSVTAEPFYAALAYEARERGEHVLGSGQPMACVKMRKDLWAQRPGLSRSI
jgi:putative acetyltransferase